MLRAKLFRIISLVLLAGLLLMTARRVLKWQTVLSFSKRDATCFNRDTPMKLGAECPMKPAAVHPKCQRFLHGIELRKGLVLGKLRNAKVFLSVGLIYAAGEETAVRATLASIFKHVAPQEQNDVVVVVVLGNSNQLEFLKDIQREFGEFLKIGVLQVISPTEKFYNAVYRGDVNWEEFSNEFKRSTTTFNMRLVYLMEHCRRLSTFYLQMSSFCRVPKSFLPVIREATQSTLNTSYTYGMFYRRGILSLGGLLTPYMVRDMVELLAMFPNGGVPWKMFEHFRILRNDRIKTIPAQDLFCFAKVLQGQKPSAKFYTDLKAGAPEFGLQDAYSSESGYYWAVRPRAGQTFVMTFEEPVHLSHVRITSGTPFYRDILKNGVLRACDASGSSSRCEASRCTDIGKVDDTLVDSGELDNKLSFPVKCLQFVITEDHKSWVIFRDISVWIR